MILQMNIYGSLLIIFTVLIRAVAINKLPKKVFIVLWLIIAGRLLIPYSIPQIINVYPVVNTLNSVSGERLINQPRLPQEESVQLDIPAVHTSNMESNIAADNLSGNFVAYAAKESRMKIYMIVWLAGVFVLGALFIVPHIIQLRKYREALPLENNYIYSWVDSHRLRRKYKVMVSDEIISPFTYGLFRPVILLSENVDINNRELTDYILTHEYIHIKCFDVVLKWVSAVTLCVNWFNPLVWAMYILMNRDIELSCDESVVRLKGETNKKSYAMTLLDMEVSKKSFNPLVNNFNKNSLKERVTAVMKIKKTTALSIILAVALIITSAMILISSCTNSNEPDEPSAVTDEEAIPNETVEKADPYAHVRFGESETRDILLIKVDEWHTPETYAEYIEEYKNSAIEYKQSEWFIEQNDEYKKDYEEKNDQTIKLLEEELQLMKEQKLYVSKTIPGAKPLNQIYIYSEDGEPIDLSEHLDSEGYYIKKLFPCFAGVSYRDENNISQYKYYGEASSRREYDFIMENEIIPFCDEMLANGQMTQEEYDFNTKDVLDIYVDVYFSNQ